MGENMTVKQKVVNTIKIFIGIIVIIALMGALGVGAWVPFLTLVLWAAKGIKMDPKSIAAEYIGVGTGLTMGYLVQHAAELGTWAIAVFGVLVVFLFIVMINRISPLDMVFNDYTAAFCTVGTALAYGPEILVDYTFTLVLFGGLPLLVYFMGKKKAAQAEEASEAA